jgi:GT2 family glycosyltransferase
MEEGKKLTVVIGSVMLSNVHPHVSGALASMTGWLGRHRPEVEQVLITPSRVEIATARSLCIELAMQKKADYFFWLDDDTVCTADTLQRLLERLETTPDIHMISPMYYVRGYPFKLMAFEETDRVMHWKLMDKPYKIDDDGLIRCIALGNGCTMVRMSVFEQIRALGDSTEWYRTGRHHTEDAYFCAKARTLIPDFTCAVDTTFSADHMLGIAYVNKDNHRYMKLKHKLVKAIQKDPTYLDALETMLISIKDDEETSLDVLDYDGSLGRL